MEIYKITNINNGKLYVGSSRNFNERKRKHLRLLNLGIHHCKHLQNSFNKYGETAFVFEILEKVKNETDLIIREQHYIDLLKPSYNTITKVGTPLESKNRLIKLRKRLNKKVVQYNLEGDKIKVWGSMQEVADYLQVNRNNISDCCRGLKKTVKGYRFSYCKEPIKYNRPSRAKYKSLDERKLSWSKKSSRNRYKVTSSRQKSFIINNIRKFCKDIDLSEASVYNSIKNKKEVKGYMFEKL